MYNIARKIVLRGFMDAQLKKGVLEICVLSAIEQEESYGYKIISDLEPYVSISESTLYPILRRLEQSGAIRSRTVEHKGRLRRYFSITSKGREKLTYFIEMMSEFDRIKRFLLRGKIHDV